MMKMRMEEGEEKSWGGGDEGDEDEDGGRGGRDGSDDEGAGRGDEGNEKERRKKRMMKMKMEEGSRRGCRTEAMRRGQREGGAVKEESSDRYSVKLGLAHNPPGRR